MPSRYWSLTARRIPSLFTADFDAVNEAIARMQQDAANPAPPKDVHALLRYELCTLLLRLPSCRISTWGIDVISHHHSTLSFCDDVVILSGGRVKKQAPFGALHRSAWTSFTSTNRSTEKDPGRPAIASWTRLQPVG